VKDVFVRVDVSLFLLLLFFLYTHVRLLFLFFLLPYNEKGDDEGVVHFFFATGTCYVISRLTTQLPVTSQFPTGRTMNQSTYNTLTFYRDRIISIKEEAYYKRALQILEILTKGTSL
jgi:hypothetical protein